MKEQYKHLDLNNPHKWGVIKNEQPKGLNDYSKLDLQGKHWVAFKNPDIWKPKIEEKIEERRKEHMENRITPGEAIQGTSAVADRVQPLRPVLMPYQSIVDVEPITSPKPERLKRAERQGGPTNKERHALRDLAAGRQVAPKIEDGRLQELLDQRAQQEQVSLTEGLQALDAVQDRTKGGVIVDFTK